MRLAFGCVEYHYTILTFPKREFHLFCPCTSGHGVSCCLRNRFWAFFFITSSFIVRKSSTAPTPTQTWVWIRLPNWARLLRSPVCRSCHRTKSLARAMCEMRLWLWLLVASHQPLSSLDFLLSPTLTSTHPSSSGCNHPSENTTSMESQGSAPVHWQTREEITYHSQMCDCRILPVSPVF